MYLKEYVCVYTHLHLDLRQCLIFHAFPPSNDVFVAGDVDRDGKVSILDLVAVNASILGVFSPQTLFPKSLTDIDRNGSTNIMDVVSISFLVNG